MWSWLVLNHGYPRLLAMLETMLNVPTKEAERTLVDILREWQDAQLIQVQGGTDG